MPNFNDNYMQLLNHYCLSHFLHGMCLRGTDNKEIYTYFQVQSVHSYNFCLCREEQRTAPPS